MRGFYFLIKTTRSPIFDLFPIPSYRIPLYSIIASQIFLLSIINDSQRILIDYFILRTLRLFCLQCERKGVKLIDLLRLHYHITYLQPELPNLVIELIGYKGQNKVSAWSIFNGRLKL